MAIRPRLPRSGATVALMDTSAPASTIAATKAERVDFLKQVVAFTEGNNRAYDTKAQISLAAFVLSLNPMITVANSVCTVGMARTMLLVVIALCVVVTISYLLVLWPVTPAGVAAASDSLAQDLFYLRNPVAVTPAALAQKLENLSAEDELTHEALKLAAIRGTKARRFKVALVLTIIAYCAIALGLLIRCA